MLSNLIRTYPTVCGLLLANGWTVSEVMGPSLQSDGVNVPNTVISYQQCYHLFITTLTSP